MIKTMIKRNAILLGVIVCLLVLTSSGVFADSAVTPDLKIGLCNKINLQIDNVKVTTNSVETKLDSAPYIKNNFTMLPVRFVSESLGATVSWNAKTKEVTVTKDTKIIKLTLNDNKAYVNGVLKTLDIPAELTNERTMIPLRFVSENLDSVVTWNKEDRSIAIQSKACSTVEEDKKNIAEISKANTVYWIAGDIDNYMTTWDINTAEVKADFAKNMEESSKTHTIVFEAIGDVSINGTNAVAKMTRTHTITHSDLKKTFREFIDVILVKTKDNEWKVHKLNLIKMEDLPDPSASTTNS
jgi:hypothetical protein